MAVVGPPSVGYTVAGISLTVFITAGVFILIGRSLQPTVGASREAVQQARAAGRIGVARIDALRQTGTQINDQPLCEIDLTVQPLQGAAFSSTMRTIVPITSIPAFQAGTERDVAILIEGGPEVAFIDHDPGSARERSNLSVPDRDAVPFIAVQPHTRIVDGQRKGPLIGVGRKGRPLRLAVFAAVAIAAAAIVVAPYQHALGQTISALQDGRLRPDLRQPEALAHARDALQAEIGHDRVLSVFVAADYIIVEAPLSPGETRTDRWSYRDSQVSHEGPTTVQPDLAEQQFSWSDVAFDRLWSLLQTAADQVDLPLGDDSVYVVRSSDGDIHSPTFGERVVPPTISFSIRDDYGSTSFVADADGSGLTAR